MKQLRCWEVYDHPPGPCLLRVAHIDGALRVRAVIPGGPRSGPGRETRLSSFFRNETKVWVPFPTLRAAGDDTGSSWRRAWRLRSNSPKATFVALVHGCNPLLPIDGAFRGLFAHLRGNA
jgi:hypothetical protein